MAFKRKRYSGRSDNVSINKHFEDYMACVSKGDLNSTFQKNYVKFTEKDRVKKSAPHGFISRCSIQKDFNFFKFVIYFLCVFTLFNFHLKGFWEWSGALVCKSKGQIGLFFPLVIVRDIDNFNIFNVPEHWQCHQMGRL